MTSQNRNHWSKADKMVLALTLTDNDPYKFCTNTDKSTSWSSWPGIKLIVFTSFLPLQQFNF
uniref:Uncharacterized protein n=1 Tax=Melanopsichium pennsylvanicum 4 TaxID=1398559 RepID=A0A077R522_9BASI|nr:uncharacterized protein BN887_06313 [Melanopsichium pennsylvanicum 4]